ncbi:DUF2141 domain-containing protein [Massilia sp. DD77]|uniref:DUF2141 domain-containing protein n=1 Tax=Massilia sp. DD77 TaxID=3109349 RepID=UPI002FFDF752
MKLFRNASCLALVLSCAAAHAGDLAIRVDDVKSSEGSIMVAVYDSAESFLKRPAKVARVPASTGAVNVLIKDLPAGDYGFALFHDANGNGKMDRNLMGIPSEQHAFSNNAFGHMGPPSFEQTRFAVAAGGASATVSLR